MRTATAPTRGRRAGHVRTGVMLGTGIAALLGAVVLSLAVGSRLTTPAEVLHAIGGSGDPFVATVVESRYARTVMGLLAGAALAVAGTLMQGITRNPLADPGLLGINAGAAAAVVTVTAVAGPTSVTGTVWAALPGAFLAGAAAYAVGTRGGDGGMVRLVLAGAVVSAVLTAYVQAVALSMPDAFDSYRYWVVGSLAGRDFEVVRAVLPFVVLGIVVSLCLMGGLNALALGDEAAVSIGVSATWVRGGALMTATLLAAGATAAVGPIAFVGLAVPHIVRSMVGVDFRLQVPFALIVGPTLLLLSDVVGRALLRPTELMVGVVTAFVGAPVLLYAVRRMRTSA